MEKYRAIPPGYMTVGELAKKMNTTVRTLQYYDKEGLLSPSSESDGGRRLYTDKDVIRLHQIQSMKYLGFSLDDIKNRLVTLETPADVAAALSEQARIVSEKISTLSDVLNAIEKLRIETLQMQTVDFRKYADIVVNLQMKNEYYGLIKHFDDKTLDYVLSRFNAVSGASMIDTMNKLFDRAIWLQKNGVPPESEQGQAFAKEWWDSVTEFTGSEMDLLPNIMKLSQNKDIWGESRNQGWPVVEDYVMHAMKAHFTRLGINPFAGVEV